LDHAYWLQEIEDEEEMEEEREDEEEGGWEKWLHPASTSVDESANQAFFSEYMRFIRQSSHEEWMKEAPVVAPSAAPVDAPTAAPAVPASSTAASVEASVVQASIRSINRSESMASTVSSRRSSVKEELPSFTDSWLMNTPLTWHKHHQHHYGECVESCRALPDNSEEMEIENLGNLSCLIDSPASTATTTTSSTSKADQEDALSQWILKPKKGKVVATKSRKNQQIPSSEWLLEAPVESSGTAERKNHYDVTEWLKTTEQKLVKELCKANEPCSGFEGCLSDINCKKSKKMDDEEKEKEDEKNEKESSVVDSDEWVYSMKSADKSFSSTSSLQEDKVNRFMRNYQVMSQDFWLTS